MNMPASSVRDLVVHENDLVVGTHGRSIWILDSMAPLRELADAARAGGAYLFGPPATVRVRHNMFSDTPLPPDEPTGQNPPEGAILDYYLSQPAREVVLEVLDGRGERVRRYSSADEPERVDPTSVAYPMYWFRPPQALARSPGHHRFAWDLRYAPPPGARRQLSIAATYRDTPTGPRGPFVHPGRYIVRLTVDGTSTERPIDVTMDPRVTASADDLRMQTELSMACYRGYLRAQALVEAIDAALASGPPVARRERLTALRGSGEPDDPDVLYSAIDAAAPDEETVVGLQEKLLYMLNVLQSADTRPTPQAEAAVRRLEGLLPVLEQRLKMIP
jgi:hypothetical protein